ncbi:hypothetical protein [Sporolactobacillus terrae]|uniref:hypothetical protein n=1 Tax=Sporolactobacillus terrae TaxID=269673 RepID=UPI00048CF718|nr:hypothetical protein [Sporolactobacillus terrae]
MDFTSVDQYLNKMHFADLYKALDPDGRQSIVFEATELLKDKFRESLLTDRIVSLQVNYMLEGESEEYAKLRRHGVTAASAKDVSMTFEGRGGETATYDPICPDVQQLIGGRKASVGELI